MISIKTICYGIMIYVTLCLGIMAVIELNRACDPDNIGAN